MNVKRKSEILDAVHNGNPIQCSKEEYPEVRKILHEIASDYANYNDVVRLSIVLEEIKRLDKKFSYRPVSIISLLSRH